LLVDPLASTGLPELANACHDLAARYLVRFIGAQDAGDQAAAADAWERYERYWQAEALAVDGDETCAAGLPDGLRRLLEHPGIAREIAETAGSSLLHR